MSKRHFGGSNLPSVECIDAKHGVWVSRWDFKEEEDGNVSFLEQVFDHEPTEAERKNSAVVNEHPYGDEEKILRKTLAKVLKTIGKYDDEEFAEFKAYNEFVDSL